ncbi:MAG: hypothetical protein HYW25_00740 [Candidatus Aenigmarchaeota archaeon]|nr:hypothetical protein [Candidatus Aenigmarchaeota archaeon]
MTRKRAVKNKARARKNHKSSKDIRLLQEGFIPEQTKMGTPFKGKNKIIVV